MSGKSVGLGNKERVADESSLCPVLKYSLLYSPACCSLFHDREPFNSCQLPTLLSIKFVFKTVDSRRATTDTESLAMTSQLPKPLRTALIGLSSSPTGFGWLNYIHLPCIQSHSSELQMVGVLSSSLSNSQKAIDKHSFPSSVRAYSSPEDLGKTRMWIS